MRPISPTSIPRQLAGSLIRIRLNGGGVMRSDRLGRLARWSTGALLLLLIQCFAAPRSAWAGCNSHLVTSQSLRVLAHDHLDELITGGISATHAAGPERDRPAPRRCSGPGCSGGVPGPSPPPRPAPAAPINGSRSRHSSARTSHPHHASCPMNRPLGPPGTNPRSSILPPPDRPPSFVGPRPPGRRARHSRRAAPRLTRDGPVATCGATTHEPPRFPG